MLEEGDVTSRYYLDCFHHLISIIATVLEIPDRASCRGVMYTILRAKVHKISHIRKKKEKKIARGAAARYVSPLKD